MPPVPSEGEISPLRFASVEMTRGALANIVISSGDACRYGADGNRFDETLSREISQCNAARTIRGGDFSTPLRFGRNDERGARQHRHLERGDASVWVLGGNRFDETLSREISQCNAARTIRGGERFLHSATLCRNDERACPFSLKSAPEGRHHHPRPEGPLPPERKRCNPFTQPAASAAPFFYNLRPKGATTTLGLQGRQT